MSTAIFGYQDLWDSAYKAQADTYRAIDNLQLVAKELVEFTKDSNAELVHVVRALLGVNLAGMTDVMILTGNGRGAGAVKIARSMFEVPLTAEYLEKNPHESDLYLDFAHVIAWNQLQKLEKTSPGKIPQELKTDGAAQYNRVKSKFEKNGRVRNNWTEKTIKKMADDIKRSDLYELVYGLASMMHHVNVGGLIGHELKWEAEALRVGHGALLQTVVTLYNVHHEIGTGFHEKMSSAIAEFENVWKEHVAARDNLRQNR